MKLAYETLEIWQLAMKLVEITHSLREQFPKEEKYGLWSQLVNAVESIPLLIAEGYGRRTPPDRAHFMDQAIASNLEAKTAFQISVKKKYVTKSQFEKLISPLIEKIHFKTIGFKKYLLRKKKSERNDQPIPPRRRPIPRFSRLNQAQKGFTLIEIIVVVGILGIILLMGSNLFFSILKSSTKTRILQLVKQNGDYAISVMGRMIRNAGKINTYSGSSLSVVNPDGMVTTFSCNDLDGNGTNEIASNGARLVSDEVKVTDCSSVFSIAAGEVGTNPDVVTINFTLSQAGATTRLEEQASVNFQTTISLRNY